MSQTEVAENDYNLNVARYVEVTEEVAEVDLKALREERAWLKTKLASLETKLASLLKGIGHD
ncbi:hypothetical protein D3C78_1870290 [compost metagenome]